MASKKIRVRIAPSPTGPLHIGTARTALFNYLFAKKNKGVFILRIEDTDLERSDPKFEEDIKEGLRWLNIIWDEFYKQSERIKIYEKYLRKLLNSGQAFYCYHTEEELEKERKEKLKRKKPPIHICEHYNKKPKTKKRGIIRFRPPKRKVVFNDIIRGRVEFDSSLLGDISIAKDLNTPLYNFAVVVDDYEMKITHVIRGEDHISNTPKQILLYKALGLPIPKFAHLPLILGPDRTKLSKRHGATSIREYRNQGYLPESLINFMALLGWNPGNDREIFSLKDLIKEFSLEKVQKSGAVFNIEKLNWLNGYYIRQMPINKLVKLNIPYLIKNGLIKPKFKTEQYPPAYGAYTIKEEYFIAETKEKITMEKLRKIIALEQERMKKLSEIGELSDFFFKKKLSYDQNLLKWKDMNKKELKDILNKLEKILNEIEEKNFKAEKIKNILLSEAEKLGDKGKLLWPFRVALTGKKASPPPFEVAEILGKERTTERIKRAKMLIK